MAGRIGIARGVVSKPEADGILSASMLTPERRSPKVGALPDKARMVLAAARRCLPEDGAPARETAGETGVSLGTYFGAIDVAERSLRTARDSGFRDVTPSWYATGLPNATAAIVASVQGLTGPNLTLLGYQAGIEAIIAGCRQILAGRARTMVAGGFDLVSDTYAAKLGAAADYAGAGVIHPGAGLVQLVPDDGSVPATITGWSWGMKAADESASDLAARLAASASRGAGADAGRSPVLHVIQPGREGGADHLAAAAPIHLVEAILDTGAPGLHALIVKGFTPSAVCLLIEKHGHGFDASLQQIPPRN